MRTAICCFILFAVCLAGCSSDESIDTPKDNPKDDPSALFGTDTERYDIPLSTKSEEVNAVSQQFAFKLFKEIAGSSKENSCISPLSASFCLGMLLNGADSDTYEEIRDVLGYKGFSNEEINEYVQTMQTELPKLDGRTLLSSANSIWANKSYNLLPDFIKLNTTYYDAEVRNEAFDDGLVGKINGWCSEKTNQLIPEIIREVSPGAVCYLLNAIYFKGQWTDEFKKEDTKKETFYTSDGQTLKVDMMKQENDFNVYRDREVTTVELPYGNKALSMVVFMPSIPEEKNIDDIIAGLDQEKWNNWMENTIAYSPELLLPRFKIENSLNLIEPMQALGIKKAFTDKADFSKACSEALYINMLLQKTYLEVNEIGTEAAAATIGGMETSTGDPIEFNPWPYRICFDHPFGYIIKENSTGAILFAGKVEKP